jgi:hypothetical protein
MPHRAGDCGLPVSETTCGQLVTVHGPMVKAVCQRILRDPALAEDAAQGVFLLLVRKLPSLPPETNLGLALCQRLPRQAEARQPRRCDGMACESSFRQRDGL